MKKLLLLICIFFVFSCKSKNEKLKEQILPKLKEIAFSDSLVTKLDSLIILKIDTLDSLSYIERKVDLLYSKHRFYLSMADSHNSLASIYLTQANNSTTQAKLYYGILNSKILGEIQIEDAKEYFKKYLDENKKARIYIDSSTLLDKKLTYFEKRIKSKSYDTSNFLGYIPRFRLIGADKTGVEVKRDSLCVYMSKDLNLIKIPTGI